MNINREDMLELTRRMTLTRTCFSRIAGAYFDEEGYVDGNFNTHFLKLSREDREKNLAIAKTIPFAETNVRLKNLVIPAEKRKPGGMRQTLLALLECELKNDGMLCSLYDLIGERFQPGIPYALYIFFGTYDIPRKGTDHESQWESEEVYSFLVGAFCPVSGDYEAGKPFAGFLYPAYTDRSADIDSIDLFAADGRCSAVRKILDL